jgi:serine/threonine-protein kinase
MSPRPRKQEQDPVTQEPLPVERRRPLFQVEQTRYALLRTLERRQNGDVLMLAERHERRGLAGTVVIKSVRTPASRARRHRLHEEVQLAYRLHHPAIAQVHFFAVHEGRPHIIMEHVDGPSLETVCGLMALRGRPVSTAFALHVAAEVADALHHAHALTDGAGRPLGLVHRDVSPRNVRVARTGEVKLTDFGVAWSHMVGRQETAESLRKGDVAYASPEYLRGEDLTPAADLFSLGLLLVELSTGRHLFAEALEGMEAPPGAAAGRPRLEEPPSLPLTHMLALMERLGPADVEAAAAGLPEALRAILQRALRKRPEERHASAGDLRDALRECLAREGRPYGRAEAAGELARLIQDARPLRNEVELPDEDVFGPGPESRTAEAPRKAARRPRG